MTVLLSDTYIQCLQAVDRLRELPHNWDSYGSRKADLKSIKGAKGLLFDLNKIPGFRRPDICLGESGFVELLWYWEGYEYELSVVVTPDGIAEYAYLGADGECEGEVALSDAPALVNTLLLQGAANGQD